MNVQVEIDKINEFLNEELQQYIGQCNTPMLREQIKNMARQYVNSLELDYSVQDVVITEYLDGHLDISCKVQVPSWMAPADPRIGEPKYPELW